LGHLFCKYDTKSNNAHVSYVGVRQEVKYIVYRRYYIHHNNILRGDRVVTLLLSLLVKQRQIERRGPVSVPAFLNFLPPTTPQATRWCTILLRTVSQALGSQSEKIPNQVATFPAYPPSLYGPLVRLISDDLGVRFLPRECRDPTKG
jgi:hypothetical protein